MAIGSEDGSASRNATLGTAGQLAVAAYLPQRIKGFAPYLPSNAGGALWGSPLGTAHALSPWTGFACLCGYAVVLTAVAAWRLRRRDA